MICTGKHYEDAFEAFLEQSQLAYVSISQLKKATMHGQKLKSFDYIIHPGHKNAILADIKGRKLDYSSFKKGLPGQNWVTADDVDSMLQWQNSFGTGHDAAFIFAYWLHDYPEQEYPADQVFAFDNRYYWMIAIYVLDYKTFMKKRSSRWNTIYLPANKFRLLCKPFNQLVD